MDPTNKLLKVDHPFRLQRGNRITIQEKGLPAILCTVRWVEGRGRMCVDVVNSLDVYCLALPAFCQGPFKPVNDFLIHRVLRR